MAKSSTQRPRIDDRSLLKFFNQEDNTILKFDEIAEMASIDEDDHRKLKRSLKRLVNDGWLARLKGKRYQLAKRTPTVNQEPEKPAMGLFRRTGDSIHVEPLYQEKRNYSSPPILIQADQMTEGLGDRHIVQYEIVTRATRNRAAFAKVLKLVGKQGDREVGIMKRILDQDLPVEFPSAVKEEAHALPNEVQESDHSGRRDLRKLPLVTIDGADAKDFDDAVCAEKTSDGFVLYVAIADVSHYVRPGSHLDTEAYFRSTSVYLSDRCIPMLPEKLSNGLCSLRPDVERLCFVAEMTIDQSGHVRGAEFYRAIMRSQARLTYDQVAAALEGQPDDVCQGLLPNLMRLSRVASSLLKRRIARGSIDLDIPEPVINFDDDGQPSESTRRPRNNAHRLIEDLMLAANEAVARRMNEQGRASLFRIHEDPDRDKLQSFLDLAGQLGLSLKLKRKPKPKDISLVIEEVSKLKSSPALQMLILRSMAQARYAPENIGHFGLSAEHYLHFTSPIRRYPDLVVHRLLADALEERKPIYSKDTLQEMAEECSTKERRAMGVERQCLDFDRAIVAHKYLGESFEGVITGVQNFGMFVAIQEPFVEGLIPISSMAFDYFVLDDIGASLIGESTGQQYILSQTVEVKIVHVDLEQGRVEFRLVEDEQTEGQEPFRRRNKHKRSRRGQKQSQDSARSSEDSRTGASKKNRHKGKKESHGKGKPRGSTKASKRKSKPGTKSKRNTRTRRR